MQDRTDPRERRDIEPDAPSETPLQDWVEAENSRPTLPDETADGLDDMDEAIRREAEDIPSDATDRENL